MVSWPIVTVQGRSAVAADRWRTRANALSLLRLAVAPALAAAIVAGRAELATALFALAVATDFADGAVARRYGEASPLGGLLDHAIDATFCVLGLAAHAAAGVVPWSLPLLVAAAFAQYVARFEESRRAAAARESARALERHRVLRGGRRADRARHARLVVAGRSAGVVARRRTGRRDARLDGRPRARAVAPASALTEELAVRAAQEHQPDRRVEEDEEVVHARARTPPSRRGGRGRAPPTS